MHATRSSDRTLGLVFAVFLALVGLAPLLRREPSVRIWALALSAAFLLCALLAPAILGPLNRVWTRFGLLLHRLTSPIVLGVLFFGVFAPLGFIYRRVLGKDLLNLSLDAAAGSYWVKREAPGPAPESMLNQW